MFDLWKNNLHSESIWNHTTSSVIDSTLEDEHRVTAEVLVLWGDTVLSARHIMAPGSFTLGEESDVTLRRGTEGLVLPLGSLPTPGLRTLLSVSPAGAIIARILPGISGVVACVGQPPLTFDDAVAHGVTLRLADEPDTQSINMSTVGTQVRWELSNGVVIQATSTPAGKKFSPYFLSAATVTAFACIALSFLVHAGLLSGMAWYRPMLADSDDEETRREQIYLMQQYLKASAVTENDMVIETSGHSPASDQDGGTGQQAKNDAGIMGSTSSIAKNLRYAVKQTDPETDPSLSRFRAIEEAKNLGVIGLLKSGYAGDPFAPTTPWGGDITQGKDALSALGNLGGPDIGEAAGGGGLGLSGIGVGGDGAWEGIGLGAIGTIGVGSGHVPGAGAGPGTGGFGRSRGIPQQGSHRPHGPSVLRSATTEINGHLPKETIQRIVRQGYGRFRLCYEQGLKNNPSLQGRVSVRFVIGRDGNVANVSSGGSDLADAGVVSCVAKSFHGLSFPQPDGGIVTVTYPILFSPGADS